MLKLVVGGDELQLSTNTSITLIFENPLLSPDRIPIPASLNIDLPPTRTNLAKFGNPDRLSSKISVAEQDAHLFFGPIEIFTGKAAFVSFGNNILKILIKSISLLDLTKNLSQIDLGSLNLGIGNRNKSKAWRKNFDNHLLSSLTPASEITYPSILVNDSNIDESLTPFIINKYNNEINDVGYHYYKNITIWEYNDRTMIWVPYLGNLQMKSFTYPCFNIGFVIQKHIGNILENNPFDSELFKNVYVTTLYHKDFKSSLADYQFGNYYLDNPITDVDPVNTNMIHSFKECMPDSPFADFFKSIMKLFGFICFAKNNQLKIISSSDIINSNNSVDWSSKVIGNPSILREDPKNLEISYKNSDSESTDGATVKVYSVSDIFSYPGDKEQIFEVTSTNEIWKVSFTVSGKTKKYSFEQIFNGISNTKKIDRQLSEFKMEIPICIPNMTVEKFNYDAENIDNKKNLRYIPKIDGNVTDIKGSQYLILYKGLTKKFTSEVDSKYPFASNHNRDAFGVKFNPFSLHLDGEDGIINTFHKEFKEWLSKDKKKIDVSLALHPTDIKNVDMSRKHQIQNASFYIEKLTVSINNNGVQSAQASLIEA